MVPAIVAWVVILTLFQAPQVLASGTSLWIAAAFQACLIVALTIMVVRYGLLVTAVAFAVGNILEDIPLTLSLSHWTATTSSGCRHSLPAAVDNRRSRVSRPMPSRLGGSRSTSGSR